MGALDMGLTEDISIHAPRTGSDEIPSASPSAATISIHAPRTGSDHPRWEFFQADNISIHAPRTGSDGSGGGLQSTLPARGATQN